MKIKEIAYHRNGVGGNGFHVVTFKERGYPKMVAVVFEERGNVAAFDRELLSQGVIKFGVNSWRGADEFEKELRAAIETWTESRRTA